MYPKEQERNMREEMLREMMYSLASEIAMCNDSNKMLKIKQKIDVITFERRILADIAALEKLVV